MSCEDIFEPIDVITLFENGGVQPLRFRWNGRVYKIAQVHNVWSLRQQQYRTYHFSVQGQGPEYFEIVFDPENFEWQLARVAFEAS